MFWKTDCCECVKPFPHTKNIYKVVCFRFTVFGKGLLLHSMKQIEIIVAEVQIRRRAYSSNLPTISLLLSFQTLWCDYSKESSRWDDSYEYPQHWVSGFKKRILESTKLPLFRALIVEKMFVPSCLFYLVFLQFSTVFQFPHGNSKAHPWSLGDYNH